MTIAQLSQASVRDSRQAAVFFYDFPSSIYEAGDLHTRTISMRLRFGDWKRSEDRRAAFPRVGLSRGCGRDSGHLAGARRNRRRRCPIDDAHLGDVERDGVGGANAVSIACYRSNAESVALAACELKLKQLEQVTFCYDW